MHIPDGFLSPQVFISGWVVALVGLSYSLKKTKEILKDKMVPLMGVSSAFIFASQMLNFPVAGGTSGHLLGGVLSAVLLGPYVGAIVITLVLIVQCLIFQDGGLTALGTNIFNMSFLATIGGYLVYNSMRIVFRGNRGIMVRVAIASWLSVVIASSACAFELAISGTSLLRIALPAMAGVHALIGVGEAMLTCLVVSFILKVRPDLIYNALSKK